MSVTPYFILLNRTRLDKEVASLISDVLSGNTDEVISILKSQRGAVAAKLDQKPMIFFQYCVQLAINVVEGNLVEAFVDELTPLITDPTEAWKFNVDTIVRGGLALSVCSECPNEEMLGALAFSYSFSEIIRQASPTANEVADHDDAELVEEARVGIFQVPELFLRRCCVEKIADELKPLIESLTALSETEETIQSLQHFHALVSAPIRNSELALLRGYI